MREVSAHDLTLFAINTGRFYEKHKHLAASTAARSIQRHDWREHVLRAVLPLYRREVEPVEMSESTWTTVADDLRYYYKRHVAESLPTFRAALWAVGEHEKPEFVDLQARDILHAESEIEQRYPHTCFIISGPVR